MDTFVLDLLILCFQIKNEWNEINERKSYSKELSGYVTIFDYKDKILIILSATTSGI